MAGVWAELMTDGQVGECLPALARLKLRLGLALPAQRIGEQSVANLTRDAAELGVETRLWPLLPESEGYWIGETNVDAAARALDLIVRWRERPGGVVAEGISIDLEPDYAYAEALRTTQKTQPSRWLALLKTHVDPPRFAKARDALARAVARTRQSGLTLHAVTFPLVLDADPGDTTIEDAFDIPLSGIDWDEVSVMAYQTAFAQQAGMWLGPSLVYSYASDAVARFGERAGIDVGVVGDVGLGIDPGDRYPGPASLHADVAAALAAGISIDRLRVYSLAGAEGAGGVQRWLDLSAVLPAQVEVSREVTGLRNTVRALGTALRATG